MGYNNFFIKIYFDIIDIYNVYIVGFLSFFLGDVWLVIDEY